MARWEADLVCVCGTSAILNARYFVFITGWSVMTNITMLRGGREIWPSDPMRTHHHPSN